MSALHLKVRQPRFADNLWYPSDASELQAEIQGYLAGTPADSNLGILIGLVAPHAGHFFSGQVAGAAFANVPAATFETVILIGPDHHGAAPHKISTLHVDSWHTPLGDIPVAWDILQALQDEIDLVLLATDEEHALEIELPFLQMTIEAFELIPLMMGNQSPHMCQRLGLGLVKALQTCQKAGKVLLVASSDLSHYFDDDTARHLDKITLQFILNLDADGLARYVETERRRGQPLACGAGPIATIIHAAKALGATQARLSKYATSADAHPRKDRVVGYAAVAIGKA